MQKLVMLAKSLGLILALTSSTAFAEAPRIVTWNINGGQQDREVLADNAVGMMEDIGPFDVLVLQEVISSKQVAAIADKLALDHWAISDFSAPLEITGKWFRSLEVAVLSKTPFVNVAEWDTTGPKPYGDQYDPRVSETTVPTESLEISLKMERDERPSRGFLRADLQNGLSIYAVHWKSSRGASGNEDLANAAKRENAASGLAVNAAEILNGGGSVVIAGDFNIQPIGKNIRVGVDIDADCEPDKNNCGPGGVDGYDDSMQIVSEIGNGYRLLSAEISPTYLARDFGPGAIDHIAVAGPMAADFPNATTIETSSERYNGSDHAPVMSGVQGADRSSRAALLNATNDDRDTRVRQMLREVRDRLDILEEMISQ